MTTCAVAMERGKTCAAMIYDLGRPDVADWQLAWLWCLALIAPDGPAVECGVAHGGSVACWAAAREKKQGPVIAVDLKFRAGCRERWAGYGYQIQSLEMASWDAPARIQGQVAFCFIDAEHGEGFAKDIAAWPAKMLPGGILAIHDYDVWKPGVVVKKYVDAWQAKAQWQFLGQVGALIAFRRPAG